MFKKLVASRRCIIPASGFYEWKRDGKNVTPYLVQLKGTKLFGLAGLWKDIIDEDGQPAQACVIITVPANEKMEMLHDRMPAILGAGDEKLWLDPDFNDAGRIIGMLRPYPDSEIELVRVSNLVNSSRVESPECIVPVKEDAGGTQSKSKQLLLFDGP